MTDRLTDEAITFIIKFIIIPLIAVTVKLSVIKMRGGKITRLNAGLSLFVGVTVAVILKKPIEVYISDTWSDVAVAAIAILSDKIAETVITKIKIDLIIMSLINNLLTPKSKD